MHVFKYSVRKGTKAEKMKNQITPEIKEERSKILLELSDKNEKEYLQSYIGKKLSVLFEEREGDYLKGHTSNYLMVKVKTEKDLLNNINCVLSTGVDDFEVLGEII